MMRIGITICLLLFLSCTKSVETRVNIILVDHNNKPINQASIHLNSQMVGSTDTKGRFSYLGEWEENSKIPIKITKEHENKYFAPYQDAFIASSSNMEISLNAKMFSVPKPTRKEINSLDIQEGQRNDQVSEGKKNPVVLVAEDKTPKTSKEEPVKELSPIEKIAPIQPIQKNRTPPKNEQFIITIHAYSKQKKLSNVDILIGRESTRKIEKVCQTNRNGRCLLKLDDLPKRPIKILARKKGFQTANLKRYLKSSQRIRVNLEPGKTLDVFAKLQSYSLIRGLDGIKVSANKKILGTTDMWGHFSHSLNNNLEAVNLTLESRAYFPRKIHSHIILSGNTEVHRYFSKDSLSKPRIAIAPLQISDNTTAIDLNKLLYDLQYALEKALQTGLSKNFATVPPKSLVQSYQIRSKQGFSDMIRSGWRTHRDQKSPDAMLVPTLLASDTKLSLDLSIIDDSGKTIAAGMAQLESLRDLDSLKNTVENLTRDTLRRFPYEGTVIGVDSSHITINWPESGLIPVKVDSLIQVLGTKIDRLGEKIQRGVIGWGTITKTNKNSVLGTIEISEPRSHIGIGDLVRLQQKNTEKNLTISVTSGGADGPPLEQVNLYDGKSWIGSTDEEGNIRIDTSPLITKSLRLVRAGYVDKTIKVPQSSNSIRSYLSTSKPTLRLETQPENLTVFINGQDVGKSPLTKVIRTNESNIQLLIKAPAGFKNHQENLTLHSTVIDKTGPGKIVLEQDHLDSIKKLVNRNKINEAIERLDKIPSRHSDYLPANNYIALIFLDILGEPHKAAMYFNRVTSNPRVANFQDNAYLESFLGESIAIFQTAENLENLHPKTALEHYRAAIKIINRSNPHLEKNENHLQTINANYYLAKGLTKIHQLSRTSKNKRRAAEAWQLVRNKVQDYRGPPEKVKAILEDATDQYKVLSKSNLPNTNRQTL